MSTRLIFLVVTRVIPQKETIIYKTMYYPRLVQIFLCPRIKSLASSYGFSIEYQISPGHTCGSVQGPECHMQVILDDRHRYIQSSCTPVASPELSPLPPEPAPALDPITAVRDSTPDQPSKQSPNPSQRLKNLSSGSGRCLKTNKVLLDLHTKSHYPRGHSPLSCERGNDERRNCRRLSLISSGDRHVGGRC